MARDPDDNPTPRDERRPSSAEAARAREAAGLPPRPTAPHRPPQPRTWPLSEHEREVGRAGVAAARARLADARRAMRQAAGDLRDALEADE